MLSVLKPARASSPVAFDRIDRDYKRLRWQVFTGIFVGYAAFYLVRKNFALAMPDILAEYPQYSKAQLGWALTGLSVAYGVSKFIMGSVSDRSNPRWFMTIGLLLTAGVTFAFGAIPAIYGSLAAIVLLQTLNGWFNGMGWPPCGKTMVHGWSTKERGVTVSVWNVAHNIGGGLVAKLALIGVLLFHDWGAPALAQEPAPPLVIAHRGASGYLPEHTLEAKAYAHALGVDYIEQDLVLSKDDVPIVIHDIHLDTTTDVATRYPGRKRADGRYYVLDFTVAELKQLRVTERVHPRTGRRVFPQRFPAGQSSFQLSTLEEELQLIQGLNRSTGRVAGIYPEIKQPKWHRVQGHDISRVVLTILARHGYSTKDDPCFLQCFELQEVRRLRDVLGWRGRLVMLIEGRSRGADETDHDYLCTPAGLQEIAQIADGIGPPIARLAGWPAGGGAARLTELAKHAQAEKLVIHPYTVRIDDLPGNCPSADALHSVLFQDLRVDGVFTDFPDVTAAWVRLNVLTPPVR